MNWFINYLSICTCKYRFLLFSRNHKWNNFVVSPFIVFVTILLRFWTGECTYSTVLLYAVPSYDNRCFANYRLVKNHWYLTLKHVVIVVLLFAASMYYLTRTIFYLSLISIAKFICKFEIFVNLWMESCNIYSSLFNLAFMFVITYLCIFDKFVSVLSYRPYLFVQWTLSALLNLDLLYLLIFFCSISCTRVIIYTVRLFIK